VDTTASVLESAIGAIIGVIGLLVYATIYAALNKETISASTQSMLTVVPIILAAVIVVSIVLTGFALRG
jgi:multisubunit Na+/H+ antiporter MnhG subunit